MAPMAYRGCLVMHWHPELDFYRARSSKLSSVPRMQAVAPRRSFLQLLLIVLLSLSPPSSNPNVESGRAGVLCT